MAVRQRATVPSTPTYLKCKDSSATERNHGEPRRSLLALPTPGYCDGIALEARYKLNIQDT